MYHPGGHQPEYVLEGRLYPPMLMPGRQHEVVPAKICGACGDRAKSLHFGGMACDSCKAFFRRSVQNEAYKHFRCAYEHPCVITISSRKSCQACRFRKCEQIGMEKSWVMTEEERTQQLKIRQEKRRQKQEEEERRCQAQEFRLKPHVAQISERHLYLSGEDISEIENLVETFYDEYQQHPVPDSANRPRSSSRVVDAFIVSVSRISSYVSRLEKFRSLPESDQKSLLKHGVLSMVILRGVMTYDEKQNSFLLKAAPKEDGVPTVGVGEIKGLLSADLYDNHRKFLRQIKNMHLDEKSLMLLQLVVLYSPDWIGLSDPNAVSSRQEHYANLLRRYMNWWHGEENTRVLYPRMLHRLTDLRCLTEAHNKSTIKFPDPDIGKVVEKFKKIDLNPYPACPEFLQGLKVLQPSAVANRDPASERQPRAPTQARTGRGPVQSRADRQLARSHSLPGYTSGLGRYMLCGAAAPEGAEAAAFQAHAQYGVAGYPGEVYGGSPQACSYLPHQWNPAYQEAGPPLWVEEERLQREPTPLNFTATQECDFNSLLGMDGRVDKRPKEEPSSPMLSPAQSHQLLIPPQHTATGYVTSHGMTSPQYIPSGQQSPFPGFQHQEYDPGRHGFSESPDGYQGSYPRM